MASDIKPFRIAGNVYFVGCYAASSHLLDTGDGLILIDVGYEKNAPDVIESITQLGFDIKDVKHIIATHGHRDHFGGIPEILCHCRAKTYIGAPDAHSVNFTPDVLLQDGDVILCGDTAVECLATPGHTNGTFSFFFNVRTENGTFRAGMFGGAGTNQLRKSYLDKFGLFYFQRGDFYRSLQKLKKERVDIFLGNHAWHNDTRGKALQMDKAEKNPFADPDAWKAFLEQCEKKMDDVIAEEIRTDFVCYAHRGASEYCPENTLLSFYTGLFMGANGIETDVQKTADGVPVLFHDNTLTRLFGTDDKVSELSFEELRKFIPEKNGVSDKIVSLDMFLSLFAFRDITFAIELKSPGVEEPTADLIAKYALEKKCVVTSFDFEKLRRIREYKPELKTGWLVKEVTEETLRSMKEIGCDELCPKASVLTEESVKRWHREGFRVRAWGVTDENVMRHALACGADGMTVNFPDKLVPLIRNSQT